MTQWLSLGTENALENTKGEKNTKFQMYVNVK